MKDYIVFTDSACDLSNEMLKERGVYSLPLTFRFEYGKEYKDKEIHPSDFYARIREGQVAKTAAVNPSEFIIEFEKLVKRGYDILYLGFSSVLSTTYNSARVAADAVLHKYPRRKIITVDTLCASAGVALLIDLILKRKEDGASITEAAEYAEQIKHKICHWFTVDDLEYLKRGGRISPSAAFFGNMLGIKPILQVDNAGMLVNKQRVRGRRTAIQLLAEKCACDIDRSFPAIAYISHADCESDAFELKRILKEQYGINTDLITNVGAVIGAHSGPGTLALFFVGEER